METWYKMQPRNFIVKLTKLLPMFILPKDLADSGYISDLVLAENIALIVSHNAGLTSDKS